MRFDLKRVEEKIEFIHRMILLSSSRMFTTLLKRNERKTRTPSEKRRTAKSETRPEARFCLLLRLSPLQPYRLRFG